MHESYASGGRMFEAAPNEQLQPTLECTAGAQQARRASLRLLRAVRLSRRG